MPRISVHEEFKFSPDGREVVTYGPGEHEVTELCAGYACSKGRAVEMGPPNIPSAPPQPVVFVKDVEVQLDPLVVSGGKKVTAKKATPKATLKGKTKPKS